MAMYKTHEEGDFLDFPMDDFLSWGGIGSSSKSLGGFWDSQLCIPDDPIEDLEWFPNFADSFISLNGIPTSPDHGSLSLSGFPKTPEQEVEEKKKKATPWKSFDDGCLRKVIPSKKPRSKRVGRRDWTSMKVQSPPADGGVVADEKSGDGVVLGTRCTHCGAENTPQWRKGPMGPKTLCNACGVRYKSGRLVPEYRPAASPNFIDGVYSNSHKKIMKMRG